MFPSHCDAFTSGSNNPAVLRFLELSRAYQLSRAFSTAVKLDLFTALQEASKAGPNALTASDIAQKLGLKADPEFRGTSDFLDLLVSLDCLNRSGEGSDAVYSNTPDGERYLSRHSPDYIGGIALINHNRSYPQFLFLEETLRRGALPPEASQLVGDVVEVFQGGAAGGADTQPATEEFALGMTGANKANFQALAKKFDFSRYKTLGDFGGSAGTLCCCVVAAHHQMWATTYDLPAVSSAAERHIAQWRLQGKVKVADLDIFAVDEFPPSDVITMSMILHDWGLDRKKELIKKAYAAVSPGGAFIALDAIIDDERRSNCWGLGMSLNMMLEFGTENSFDYTFKEFQGWVTEAGFSRTELIRLPGAISSAVAYK